MGVVITRAGCSMLQEKDLTHPSFMDFVGPVWNTSKVGLTKKKTRFKDGADVLSHVHHPDYSCDVFCDFLTVTPFFTHPCKIVIVIKKM